MSVTQKWNAADKFIFYIENKISDLFGVSYATSHKDDDVDVETIIAAETEHLREENEKLKQLQRPGRVICNEDGYACPNCENQIANELLDEYGIKFCPECGKRIILFVPVEISYATSHKVENNVNI